MKIRNLVILIALLGCMMLSGCQLAVDGSELAANADRFVGLSIRVEQFNAVYEEWELPETEDAYIGEAMMEGDDSITIDSLGSFSDADGELPLDDNYLIAPTYGEQDNRYIGGGAYGSWLADGGFHINSSDDSEEIIMEATIYLIEDEQFTAEDRIIYFDSVYQRPDDSLYALREGGGISGHIGGFARTISTESTRTTNGEVKSSKVSCTINIQQVDETIAAELLEFDEDHALIARHVLTKPAGDELIIDVQVSKDTAYAVIEKTVIDQYEKQQRIERSIVNAPFDGETTQDRLFFRGEQGIADIRSISISAAN